MKVCHCWTSTLFVMAVLCLTLNADGEKCENEMKVRRHTTYEAGLGGRLTIACPVQFCNGSTPKITWFKLEENFVELNLNDDIQTEWTENNDEGTDFLIFNNVQSDNLGTYQCRVGTTVSHSISVTLKGDNVDPTFQNTTFQTHQNNTTTDNNDNRHMWLYLYTTVGIVGIGIIVMVISVLFIQGCNGETKKKARRENQNNNTYGRMEGDRHKNSPGEEWTTVVYTVLNHHCLAAACVSPER